MGRWECLASFWNIVGSNEAGVVSQNLAPSANLQERQVASTACWRQSSSLDGKNLLLQEDHSTSIKKKTRSSLCEHVLNCQGSREGFPKLLDNTSAAAYVQHC